MELFKSIKTHDKDDLISDELLFRPVFRSVEYEITTIIDKINSINELSDDEIKNIILRQHSMILNYDLFLKSDNSRVAAQKLFTNKRFLTVFLQIIGLINLTREEAICINKLAYDYYILYNKDSEISELLLQLCYQLNNVLVIKLSGILGINGARILSMISNSSFKEDKIVHRVNTFLIRCNLELSIQDIIDIFCIIYERFTYPFIYSMLEVKIECDNKLSARFDLISSALLEILNSMTSEDISKVLYNYAYTLKLNPSNMVRFSLKSAKSYPRILSVIEQIETSDLDKLIIP